MSGTVANNPLFIPGIGIHGIKQVLYWHSMAEAPQNGHNLNLKEICPDFGTEICLDCDLGLDRPLDMCDCECYTCKYKIQCPCSGVNAFRRRLKNGQETTR